VGEDDAVSAAEVAMEVELANPEEGSELERPVVVRCAGLDFDAGTGTWTDADGTEARGTPQSAQIRAACGLRPGGLRYAQTSHSQASKTLSAPPVGVLTDTDDAPAEVEPDAEVGGDDNAGRERWRVILGEDANRPV
jgi:hypothetical protein